MSMNDLLSDMLTRIRNGQQAKLARITCPYSGLCANVLDVLKREGYIREWRALEDGNKKSLEIELKYHEGVAVIHKLKRISTSGRRQYTPIADLKPFFNGLGVVILSTAKGVLSDHEARQQNVGGEVLCAVF